MNLRKTALAAFFALMSASMSFATTITVGGQDYDIALITGNVNDSFITDDYEYIAATLEAQPFWGDEALAFEFAEAAFAAEILPPVGTSLFFAYAAYGDFLIDIVGYGRFSTAPGSGTVFAAPDEPVFATVTLAAVPLPASSLLLLSGLAGVAGLRRRKKRTA